MRKLLVFFLILNAAFNLKAQIQTCPDNINFAAGDLRNWTVKTSLVNGTTVTTYPLPNTGLTTVPEQAISTTGISVITSSTNDYYGGFPTVPTINGYAYGYSVKIGSHSTSWDYRQGTGSQTGNPGGFKRSITYTINVPAGPTSVPYTMTYAYAMVLENGTHNSTEQPLFHAELRTTDSLITCASPYYYLPTLNNAGGGGGGGGTGATLDTVAAIANGFSLSPQPFFSHASNAGGGNGAWLYDVWTKGWTEVTFDLSPYRGQQVTLTFEAVNCTPGAHFAYAYVALRNVCAGLEISGLTGACTNTPITYSIPSLAGAIYNWQVPAGWTILSGANSNAITVLPGGSGGDIIAHEINGCADLRDTITVTTAPPTVPGAVNSDNTVCSGTNSTVLTLNGSVGNILNWLSSTDGITWTAIPNTTNTYTAQNLLQTTQYKARVQNGTACRIDTSTAAIIAVDPRSVGGNLDPSDISICLNESTLKTITLTGNTGTVVNWQQSANNVNWTNFAPVNTNPAYTTNSINQTTYYRTIVKSGVCPADTSSVAVIRFFNVPFPDARIVPDNASVCIGFTTPINAVINTGTSYSWSNSSTLTNQGSGTISSLPYQINAIASPPRTMDYVLTVNNAGCPNVYRDTFHVNVSPRIIVFAGNDTSVVANQPLQLNATVNFADANQFLWTPGTGLSSTIIHNPVATLDPSMGQSIMYVVRATDPAGCYGEDNIIVTIYRTGPSLFVPTGFTPNGDGLNDVIYPICVGIEKLNYFKIFNRWGQLVFSTSQIGHGWDGRIKGEVQSSNNYVFVAEGVDYNGNTIFKKGNLVLIR